MKKKLKAQTPRTASKSKPSSKAATKSAESLSKWIRIEKPFPLPSTIRQAIGRLDSAGHIAYVVGGSIRDFLLNRIPKDHDIATNANPDELCSLFPEAIEVGKKFGVIKIPVQLENGEKNILEIASFRKDLAYQDHRHPTGVLFAGPTEDASRRDFTVNALFFDPKSGRILDTVDGLDDLKHGIIRAIGDPQVRFREDALRLLRAVRFCCNLQFKLHDDTRNAIIQTNTLIRHISAERIRDEISLMLTGFSPHLAMQMLSDLGLLEKVLPTLLELRPPGGPLWKQTIRILETLRKQAPLSVELSWAALFHSLKWNRESGPSKTIQEIGAQLKFSNQILSDIIVLLEEYPKCREAFQMREATLQRLLRHPRFTEILRLHRAHAIATDGDLAHHEFCSSRFEELKYATSAPGRVISGQDLIELGLQPGPRFSEILKNVEDLVLEKKIRTKEEALEFVLKHFAR